MRQSIRYFSTPLANCWNLDVGSRVQRWRARLPAEYGDGQPFVPLVAVLKENASDAGSALDYTDPIRENFARQKIKAAAESALKLCRDPTKPTDDILAAMEAALMDATRDQAAASIKSLGEAAKSALERTAENYRIKDEIQIGLRTGIRELDRLMGPVMGGDLITIAAPSGHGKTTLALQIMRHAAQGDHAKNGLLISQEMTADPRSPPGHWQHGPTSLFASSARATSTFLSTKS